MTRRMLMKCLAFVPLIGSRQSAMSDTRTEEGWALRDPDGGFRTRSMVGMPARSASLFKDYEVDSYAKVWGAEKVWMRRTITTICQVGHV